MMHLDRVDLGLPDLLRSSGTSGVEPLLASLDRQARDSRAGRLLGRAVERAIAWDRADQRDRSWWPQGITTSADATPTGTVAARRVVVTSWYSKQGEGVRLTFLDLGSLRYRHVRLVQADRSGGGRTTLSPVKAHAGGILWIGRHLHVAATARGFYTARLDDLTRHGGEFVLPVRWHHRGHPTDPADRGSRLRYSFLSIDHEAEPPRLLVGEYGRGGQSTRLAWFPMDPTDGLPLLGDDGRAVPLQVVDAGLDRMQGAVQARGRLHVLTSQSPLLPGTAYAGGPGRWRRHRCAVPMGPEDLTYWPQTGRLWSLTEHPRRRWVIAMRAD